MFVCVYVCICMCKHTSSWRAGGCMFVSFMFVSLYVCMCVCVCVNIHLHGELGGQGMFPQEWRRRWAWRAWASRFGGAFTRHQLFIFCFAMILGGLAPCRPAVLPAGKRYYASHNLLRALYMRLGQGGGLIRCCGLRQHMRRVWTRTHGWRPKELCWPSTASSPSGGFLFSLGGPPLGSFSYGGTASHVHNWEHLTTIQKETPNP